MTNEDRPWKAVVAGLLAFLSNLLVAVQTVDGKNVQITVEEWLIVAIATVSAAAAVYFVDNTWGAAK